MSNKKKEVSLKDKVGLVITVGGVALSILSAVIAFKLAPLYQNMAVIVERVDALEKNTPSKDAFEAVCQRLDRIEDKLDHLIGLR